MSAPRSNFFKILVIGDTNVGKTSLLNRFVNHIFLSDPKTTVGVDLVTAEVVVNNTWTTLQIWDTAGQERFHSVSTSYYRGADCCVLVYDVTDRSTFKNLDYWRHKFFDEVGADPANFPLVLIGNKVDLPNRQITSVEAEEWCTLNSHCPYYEASAKDGVNVEFVFQRVAETIVSLDIEPSFLDETIIADKYSKECSNCKSC